MLTGSPTTMPTALRSRAMRAVSRCLLHSANLYPTDAGRHALSSSETASPVRLSPKSTPSSFPRMCISSCIYCFFAVYPIYCTMFTAFRAVFALRRSV